MKSDDIHLQDILTAILKIERYLEGFDLDMFDADLLTQDAVIRNMELLGEAMRRLSPDFVEQHSELPIREAIALRNFLIHQYDDINVEMIRRCVP